MTTIHDILSELADELDGTYYPPGLWPSDSPLSAGAIFIAGKTKAIEFFRCDADDGAIEAVCDECVALLDPMEPVEQLATQLIEEVLEPAPPLALFDEWLARGPLRATDLEAMP